MRLIGLLLGIADKRSITDPGSSLIGYPLFKVYPSLDGVNFCGRAGARRVYSGINKRVKSIPAYSQRSLGCPEAFADPESLGK
jgi:hypothetical protein